MIGLILLRVLIQIIWLEMSIGKSTDVEME